MMTYGSKPNGKIISDYKVDVLPTKGKPNSRYYVPNGNGNDIDEYVTDIDGNYRKVRTISPIEVNVNSSSITTDTLIFSNSGNVTFGISNGTITASAPSGGGVGDGYNILAAGTQTGASATTIILSNSNNVSFGMSNNSIITASFSYTSPTDYISSNQSSLFQQTSLMSNYLDTGYTTHSHSQYLTTQTEFVLSNSNGISFGTNNSTVTASYSVPTDYISVNQSSLFQQTSLMSNYQSSGNYLTTAMQSNQGSNFVNTSQSSLFQQTSLMSNYQSTGNYLTSQSNQAFSASGSSSTFQTLQFGNSNGVSFSISNGSLVGTVKTDYQSSGNYLTTAMQSNAGSNFVNTSQSSLFQQTSLMSNYQTTGNYLTTAMQSNAATISNIKVSAGTLSTNRSDLTFSNENGVSFGLNTNGIITASITPSAGAQTAISGISAGTTIVTSGTLSIANSNGISFGINGNTLTATVRTDYQSQGAYLTTAAQSNQVVNSLNGSTGQISLNVGSSLSSSTNGSSITFGLASNITTALQSAGAYLTTAMVSNAGSNFVNTSAGLNLTNVSATFNSNSISLSVATPVTTAGLISAVNLSAGTTSNNLSAFVLSNSNNVSFGLNGSTLTASASYSQSTSPAAISAGGASASSGTIIFSNSNGISFGLNGNTVTASHNGLTSQSNQAWSGNNASSTFQTLSFNNANGITWSNNAGAVEITHGLQHTSNTSAITSNALNTSQSSLFQHTSATSAITSNALHSSSPRIQGIIGSNATYTSGSVGFRDLNGISWQSTTGQSFQITHDLQYTSNTSAITSNALNTSQSSLFRHTSQNSQLQFTSQMSDYLGTAQSSKYIQNWKLTGNTLGTTSSAQGTDIWFQGGNNVTISGSSNSLVFSVGNYITTARASTDAIGLNTAQSNVTWTANSNGLSLDARGYAGTGTSATNASITLNSNGLAISVGVGGGGVTPVASASNGSFSFTTLAFSNANNVTFGTSAGSIITASVAAPGAAAENNWINLLGANTSGDTTISGSTLGYSGINLTLSGTNGSILNISAPAVSSISGTGQVSISVNASTILIGVPNKVTHSLWEPFDMRNNTTFSSHGQNSIYIQKLWPTNNFSFASVEQHASLSFVSSTNSQQVAYTWDYGLYSRGTGGSTSIMTLVNSSRAVFTASYNSNTAMGFTVSQGGASFTTSSGGTGYYSNITAGKHLYFPFSMSLSEGEEYAFAWRISSASTVGTSPLRMAAMVFTNINNLTWGKIFMTTVSASNASFVEDFGQGVHATTQSALVSSYAESQLTNAISRARQYLMFE